MSKYPKLKELPLDQKTTTVVLLESVEERETRGKKAYCSLTISDGETQATAQLWNMTKEDFSVDEKSLMTVTLYPKLYNDARSYEVFYFAAAPAECRLEDFVIHAPYRPEDMYQNILTLLRKGVPDSGCPDLIHLTTQIFEDHKQQILTWSAAKSMHHNFLGGWLYHTFRMIRAAYNLSNIYPVDKELLLAGTALHDIGKLQELETDPLGIADYTVEGTLFGHALLGIQMIDQYAPGYDTEKVMLLKHMLASHHGLLEYGAITHPSIPEAMMLHEIDMIDSRMYQFEDAKKEIEPGTMSGRIFGLDNVPVYRPSFEN